jgi:uncharacterized membrane protein YvbJ
MKYCSKCGYEMLDDAVVCPKCGKRNAYHQHYERNEYQHYERNAYNQRNSTSTNGFAIAGFLCSFFIPLLGWIFGAVGMAEANQMDDKGKGLAIAAIVISTIKFIINFIVIRSWSMKLFY